MEPIRSAEPVVVEGRTDRRAAPPDEGARARLAWAVGIAAVVAAGFGVYLWQSQQAHLPPPVPRVEAPVTPPIAEEQAVIENPLAPPAAGEPPLPALAASDTLLVPALIELVGNPRVQELLQLPGLVRRIVVSVDNLPRDRLPPDNWPLRPVAGALRVSGGPADGTLTLDPANSARYAAYVKLVEAVDVQRLVALYVRTYPLFQQAYVELGYPKRYFNDRLLQVIDHLLATPAPPPGRLQLTQPRLVYEFADPALQSLSVGQKTLLRIGPENAARVKTKLTELRDEILRNSEKR
ncbi:MAG: DUF3014 domain-containing protein [Burkholderiaceae bacterium]|nr:DUF3014 domain-containing protein [Burkholderiaceae bacterium]